MIKSPQKQQNAYRVLKVLSNQDYLAVDFKGFYYVLSPVKKQYNITLKPRIITHSCSDLSRLLKPKECIDIDQIRYYVFFIGEHEVICANDFDCSRLKTLEELFIFFAGAVKDILKHLLFREIKQAIKIIDIRNCLIIKGHLYLLEISRQKLYPRSFQRLEKTTSLNESKDSFRPILEDQLGIIRSFGNLLWLIIYKVPYILRKQNNYTHEKQAFIKKIISEMIVKQITYEYLYIKIKEQEGKTVFIKAKMNKKFKYLIKKESPRYRTESMNEQRGQKISAQIFRNEGRLSITPLFEQKKIFISQINTGPDSVQTFRSRYEKPSLKKVKFLSACKSTKANSTSRNFESKISTETQKKLVKQNEVAQQLFKKFVEIKFNLREEKDQQINETLRSRLMSKIEKFRTQYKSNSRQKSAQSDNLIEKNGIASFKLQKHFKPVTKKLIFLSQANMSESNNEGNKPIVGQSQNKEGKTNTYLQRQRPSQIQKDKNNNCNQPKVKEGLDQLNPTELQQKQIDSIEFQALDFEKLILESAKKPQQHKISPKIEHEDQENESDIF